MVDITPEDLMPTGVVQTDIIAPGVWADPRIWLAVAVIIAILTILMIYYRVFKGDGR